MLSPKYYHRRPYGAYGAPMAYGAYGSAIDESKKAHRKMKKLVEEWMDLKRKIIAAQKAGKKSLYWRLALRKVKVKGKYKTCLFCIGKAEDYVKEWEKKVDAAAKEVQLQALTNRDEEIVVEGPDGNLGTGWDELAIDAIDVPELGQLPVYQPPSGGAKQASSGIPSYILPMAIGGSVLLIALALAKR
jgi:hypothetical protein